MNSWDLPFRPVEEYPRTGTYTLDELRARRLDLARAFATHFLDRLHPSYRKLLQEAAP